ncbi:MAG: NusG domain II-containing protein [Firmicutes bacterium]|nr:NusG domain II-containing protein [Bacillota bacterium]
MIKKADIALFFIILIFGLALSWFSLTGDLGGDKVLITVDNQDYGVYSLYEDQDIEIIQDNHINHITIKDGKVSMSYSTCKNQICVNTKSISEAKDTIVCLPNKVMVEITGEGGGADVISG